LKPEFQHAETLSTRHLRYRPAVFFRHHRLIALSFPQEKTGRAFKKTFFSNFVYFLKTA
jgi:hypothetical protein